MSRANKYTPYETGNGPLTADNDATALEHQAQVITTGGSAETVSTAAGAHLCRFVGDTDFWYSFDGTAAIPTVDDTDNASIYLPAGLVRYIHVDFDNATFSVISASTGAVLSLSFWD